jgi:tRNA-intron endonuclease
MKIFGVRAEMSEEEALKKLHKLDSRLSVRLPVFSDLRKKGYIVKTALKFGAEFRVYEKGAKPGEEHARWVLYAIKESEKMTWHDFSAKNRVAHSTKKKLLLAIV